MSSPREVQIYLIFLFAHHFSLSCWLQVRKEMSRIMRNNGCLPECLNSAATGGSSSGGNGKESQTSFYGSSSTTPATQNNSTTLPASTVGTSLNSSPKLTIISTDTSSTIYLEVNSSTEGSSVSASTETDLASDSETGTGSAPHYHHTHTHFHHLHHLRHSPRSTVLPYAHVDVTAHPYTHSHPIQSNSADHSPPPPPPPPVPIHPQLQCQAHNPDVKSPHSGPSQSVSPSTAVRTATILPRDLPKSNVDDCCTGPLWIQPISAANQGTFYQPTPTKTYILGH